MLTKIMLKITISKVLNCGKSSTLFEARVSASLHQCVSVDLPWQPFCERKFTGGLCVCLCLSVCLIYRVFMYSHEEDMAKIIDFPVV